jgi:hypothetical protein
MKREKKEKRVTREWCGRSESNRHRFAPTCPSNMRVYQFHHDRTNENMLFVFPRWRLRKRRLISRRIFLLLLRWYFYIA